MTKKRNSNHDEITIDNILKELTCCFETTYSEVRSSFESQSTYRRLRRIGEQQFFNAAEICNSFEEESQHIKMQFAEINLLAVSADNLIDTVISEKFQNNFLSTLKEEVLKIILKLYSDQDGSIAEKSKTIQSLQPDGNPAEIKKKDDVKAVLDKLKDMSKYFAQNLDDISKQVIEMPLENTKDATGNTKTALSSFWKEGSVELDDNNFELGNISFDSLSSVHTSDLSSFNDEISISSNEEIGRKGKRLSLKMVEEEVKQIRAKRDNGESGKKKQVKKRKAEDLESEICTDGSSSPPQKSLPQRIRKPNSKYNEFDVGSPVINKTTAKCIPNRSSTPVVEGTEMIGCMPRKRGRPRKSVSLRT